MNKLINQKATEIFKMIGEPANIAIYAPPQVSHVLDGEIAIDGRVLAVRPCDLISEKEITDEISTYISCIYIIDLDNISEESFLAMLRDGYS